MSPAVQLVTQLRDVTEAQLDAALRLDGKELDRLNRQRTDVLFELQIALQRTPSDDDRTLITREARRLSELEVRLARVASSVVHALDRVIPRSPPVTYGRNGLVLRSS